MSGHAITGRVNLCVVSTIAASIVLFSNLSSSAHADETPAVVAKAADAGSPKVATAADSSSKAQQERVQSLIHDLGDPRYSARARPRMSYAKLVPKPSMRSTRQPRIPIPKLPPAPATSCGKSPFAGFSLKIRPLVRAQLRQYGQEADTARMQHIEQLGRLPANAGVIALCRIVRYDRSPLISRMAALAIIHPKDVDSMRAAARWDGRHVSARREHAALGDLAAAVSGSAARPGRLDTRLEAADR